MSSAATTPAPRHAADGSDVALAQRANDRALPIFIVMSVLSRRISLRNAIEAIRRGRRAEYLWSQPFETLLAEPLEAVRERLGIDPPGAAHPRVTSTSMLIGA